MRTKTKTTICKRPNDRLCYLVILCNCCNIPHGANFNNTKKSRMWGNTFGEGHTLKQAGQLKFYLYDLIIQNVSALRNPPHIYLLGNLRQIPPHLVSQ